MGKLWTTFRRLWEAWIAVQVEFHGRYSVDRLSRFKNYMETVNLVRVMGIALVSPLPCLILAIMVESVPLADPGDGVQANWVFLIRFGFVTGLMVGSMVFQMGRNVPALIVKTRHILTIAALAASATVATLYAVASTTAFPVPFTMLLASPPSVVMYGICFAIFWGGQFKADSSIQREMEQQTTVLNCQMSLTLIYPMYIFGFTSFTGVYQTIFVLVLPIIKLIAKNWVSRALAGHNDLKPEAVIFNVEVFNALYISNSLQVASTQASTVTIMVFDLLHFCISMYDVMEVLSEVKVLMAKIPKDHPVAEENFVQVAMRLLDVEAQQLSKTTSHFVDPSHPTWRAQIEAWVNTHAPTLKYNMSRISESDNDESDNKAPSQTRKPSLGTRVFPISPQQVQCGSSSVMKDLNLTAETSSYVGLDILFSRKDRALFIRESARALFITEYIIMVEYVEVVLPLVYCAHHVIVYNLHNRVYYPALASLPSSEFTSKISHVLIYSSLEFGSLIVAMTFLKRSLGFWPLRQLSFVLENQAGIIQGKLLILLIYVMQISLVHIGSIVFTSYYEGDDCSGTPHFIYEESIDNCQPANCTTLTIGDTGYSRKVDCHANDRVDTAAIYTDANAPYVLLEQFSTPTGCDNFVNALAFYADGLCRVLPDIAPYSAAIAVVNASLSVELQLFNDVACTELVSNASVASTDVEWTCFVGYSDSYGLVYYTTDTATTDC